MMERGLTTWLFAAVFVLATGCGGRQTTPSVGDAAVEAQKAFATASADLKSNIGKAVQAFNSNDFVGSIVLLQTVQNTPSLTPDQLKAIDNLSGAVYEKLADLIGKGDPKAIQARQQLRSLRR